MSQLSKILAALWIFLGLALLVDAALDTIKWQSDSVYTSVGLTWNWIGLGAGALALALGLLWMSSRVARWFGYLVVIVFGLYTVAYLVLGGEGMWLYRLALPAGVLLLSVVSGWNLKTMSHKAS